MLPTSKILLERLRDRGDGQAWQRFLAVYESWLHGSLSRHDLQPADVEDVLQEVLAVVSEKLPQFVHNGQSGAFRS
jgi:DNA-directed RNA polymerase specialized sigma24 family protein